MDDNSYSLEDILLELEVKRSLEDQRPKPPKSATETFSPVKPVAKPDPKPPAPDTEKAASPVTPAPVKPAPAKPVTPPAAIPKPPVTQNTVSINTRTRVLTMDAVEDKQNTTEITPSQETPMEGQLLMEDFVRPSQDEELEHELRRRRRSKVDAFRLIDGGKNAMKWTGDEESSGAEDLLETELETDEELSDFTDYADAESIRSELNYRRRTGAVGVIAGGLMTLMLIALTAMYEFGWLRAIPAALLTAVHTVVLFGMIFVNHRMMAHGLKSLITFRADADTAPALCGVIGLVYTVAQFFYLPAVSAGQALFLSAVAAIGLFGGSLGRQMQVMRVCRNFKLVSGEKHRKLAAHYLDDTRIATEMGQNVDENGFPVTLFYRRAAFLDNFLQNSYANDPADRTMRWYVWIVLAVSVLCAGGYALLFPMYAVKAPIVLAVVSLLSLPSFSLFATQRAMSRSCKRALKQNVLIAGWDAAETFGRHTDLVVLEAQELFPKGCVKLHGIKTFSGTRIDDAIIDAAAVAIAAGGPLAPIFRHLIEQRTDILKEVDSLAYEQDMGVSGWVGGRRALIGNRRLMENHGIDMPSKEYESRYTKDDRTVVYLSTGGELSAMFVVSYLAHPAIRTQLAALSKNRIRLVVRTCDPNVTAERIAQVMGIPEYGVQVLSAGQGRAYGKALEPDDERTEALLACGGRAESKLFGLLQCRRLRRGGKAAVWSQLLLSAGMLLFAVFVTAVTGLIPSIWVMLGYMIGCGVLAWAAPKLFGT